MASDRPLCVLLLPRALSGFILRDQAQDLLRSPDVVALGPPRVPYGAIARLPWPLRGLVAARVARALRRRLPGAPRVAVIFHPVQLPVARALGAQELWYGRWDRYEHAYDASPRRRTSLARLHEQAAGEAAFTFVASGELRRLEREAGRDAALVPLAADAFPAPDPSSTVVAVSLGHLGWRTDWALLRAISERMPELVLLLVGAWHPQECAGDPDFAACRAAPNLVWLGARTDEEAARLILCADVGIVPFRVEPFNDAGLPYRILKYARLGRRTVAPELAGARTWERAVDVAPHVDAFVAQLRAAAGRRTAPDAALRAWALEQTATTQNAPLWKRLHDLGLAGGDEPFLAWSQGATQAGRPVVEILREGAECLPELRPLWLALRDHHHAVAPELGPIWGDDESWDRRRAHHERALAGAGAFVLVARESQRAVGYALVTLRGASYTWRQPAAHGELEAISVLPEAQGRGIGRALVEQAYAELAQRAIDTMTVRVIEANAQARAFYAHMGFEPWVVELRGKRVSPSVLSSSDLRRR